MTTATKAIVLDMMAKVNHESLTGDAIRHFVKEAHLKSDKELRETVDCIKSQMNDNPALMRQILGKSVYSFFNTVNI